MNRPEIVASIVEAVAAVDGVDKTDVDPLYQYIDANILNKSYYQREDQWRFTLQYSDY